MTELILKFISFFLILISAFISSGLVKWTDTMEGHDFEIFEATEKKADELRILSFNVRVADNNGTPAIARRSLVVEQIRKIAPDSFGLQEASPDWMLAIKAGLPEYGCVGVARDNGLETLGIGESSPVFYLKEKFELVDHGDFWLSETPDKPSYGPGAGCRRVCTWAKLRERATGKIYVHVNSHFDHVSEDARVFGAKLIADFISEHFASLPVVFTADMNTGEGGAAYGTMTALLSDARYAAADSAGRGTYHECKPESWPDLKLDYILCSEDVSVDTFRVVTDGVDGRFVSDHFPLYADVKF